MKKVDINLDDLIQNLTKMNVEVSIGEPWNFGEGKERNPFEAIIEQVLITIHSMGNKIIVKKSVLLRIIQPFPYNNLKCEFLLASPRHERVLAYEILLMATLYPLIFYAFQRMMHVQIIHS